MTESAADAVEVPPDDEVAAGIAAELRRRRQAAGLSMRALAARAGMSQPFLSNLENARAMPSVATLYRIAAALGVSPRDFLPQAATTALLVRAGEGPVTRVGDEPSSATARLVAGAPGRMIEARTYEVPPGAGLGGWFEHDGEDLVVVLEGELVVELGDGRRYELCAGDVLWYVASIPHRWLAAGDATTRVLLAGARTPGGAH
jgi:quercetin dioxygenase-like cupin family protein/lambda repressor-like predicted transcriptional regulator